MTAEQFLYWLQGYAEIAGEAPSAEQWTVIKDHLQLAFVKQTPERLTGPPVQIDWQRATPAGTATEIVC